MGKIFDKTTVKEKQELSQRFGEEAYKLVHVISEKNGWAEGSIEKIALHAFVGGLMSGLGGGDVLAGATGAGFNEAIQGELSKIQDPALHQWASVFVGVVAAKAVGGDAQTGGSTAASGTKNNDYAEGLNNPLIGLVVGGLAYLSSLVFPKNYNDSNSVLYKKQQPFAHYYGIVGQFQSIDLIGKPV
ncbi:Possible hemagglutinin [Pelosinus propionicus DSM 13327]|uniref:Possible hemagglutinin n=1 Tax=Pelosinus propionicus DSM 13327 TaxID=1123291 RepID=A0A1I4NY02_9FIRM|nr:DUF637 domain-containing protein [Pelosinus propionicus]SFM20411.1 Possible hemagglutinin [Pelosinus propionicus DSM 13327]